LALCYGDAARWSGEWWPQPRDHGGLCQILASPKQAMGRTAKTEAAFVACRGRVDERPRPSATRVSISAARRVRPSGAAREAAGAAAAGEVGMASRSLSASCERLDLAAERGGAEPDHGLIRRGEVGRHSSSDGRSVYASGWRLWLPADGQTAAAGELRQACYSLSTRRVQACTIRLFCRLHTQ
jgi:hypothetical protein